MTGQRPTRGARDAGSEADKGCDDDGGSYDNRSGDENDDGTTGSIFGGSGGGGEFHQGTAAGFGRGRPRP
jgi:hypothetical protein